MIDDDTFEKLFRDMIEDFFRRASPGYGEPSFDSQDHKIKIIPDDGVLRIDDASSPIMEKFEFEDHVLLVLQGCTDESSIVAKAKGNQLLLEFEDGRESIHEMPFMIDAEKSIISCRNGIAEITIMKSEKQEADQTVRLLRYA